mmetsp:Transcript_63993/g.134571  ORF Transcript_63993/g.134571 Transcript_63993/m.134571 type:complete len:282 (-) Transcript_63993:766-1611(-)
MRFDRAIDSSLCLGWGLRRRDQGLPSRRPLLIPARGGSLPGTLHPGESRLLLLPLHWRVLAVRTSFEKEGRDSLQRLPRGCRFVRFLRIPRRHAAHLEPSEVQGEPREATWLLIERVDGVRHFGLQLPQEGHQRSPRRPRESKKKDFEAVPRRERHPQDLRLRFSAGFLRNGHRIERRCLWVSRRLDSRRCGSSCALARRPSWKWLLEFPGRVVQQDDCQADFPTALFLAPSDASSKGSNIFDCDPESISRAVGAFPSGRSPGPRHDSRPSESNVHRRGAL